MKGEKGECDTRPTSSIHKREREMVTVDLGETGVEESDRLKAALDEAVSGMRSPSDVQFFEALEFERGIRSDMSKCGKLWRVLLCLYKQLAKFLIVLDILVPMITGCISQFTKTIESKNPQLGLWVGLVSGMAASAFMFFMGSICAYWSSIIDPLTGQRVYLSTTRWGCVKFMLSSTIFTICVLLLKLLEEQCLSPNTTRCSLPEEVGKMLLPTG